MDAVLDGAVALGVCKLTCSLLFLPSLTGRRSPVAFCCCCLLLFTDFLVTTFLTLLWIAKLWLPHLFPFSDAIALRFLLFLSHTYGEVLLLTTPLMAVEATLTALWPRADAYGTLGAGEGPGRPPHQGLLVAAEKRVEQLSEDTDGDSDRGRRLSSTVGYLCCLSVWVVSGLHVRWGWKLEELWAAACIHTTNSLVVCLPKVLPGPMEACGWFICLMLVLRISMEWGERDQAAAQTYLPTRTCFGKQSADDSGGKHVFSAAAEAVNPALSPWECVDPEKTQSSCSVHTVHLWKSAQVSLLRFGGSGFPLSAEQEGRGCEDTEGAFPLPCIYSRGMPGDAARRVQGGWWWWWWRGFPCPKVNVMTGLVALLSLCTLPLNLSVNVLLIQTIDTVIEQWIVRFLLHRSRVLQNMKLVNILIVRNSTS